MTGPNRNIRWLAGTLALGWLAAAPAQAAPKPLFAADAILQLRIEAPFSDLIRAAPRSTNAFDAKLIVTGPTPETLAIKLSPRGISRRTSEACEFPPLKIEFTEKPGAASLFKGQKSLKLATHCRNDFNYQDYGLLEFLAYRLHNVLTPLSFRVRLAAIDYAETGSSSVRIHRHGFLVEDFDELAERNELHDIKIDKIDRGMLNGDATARSDLFQYLIGNQDWSDVMGAAGTNCCHNIKLLAISKESHTDLLPVAYDFDSSGLVNPPYALPPTTVPIKSVRTRYYRGYCQLNAQATAAAQEALAKRDELMAMVDATPALSTRGKNSARQYLESFFSDLADPARLKKQILERCRS
jgi:hypothetical protein